MEFTLFQWIGIGLTIAIILIPIVRWFWKRFDSPSKRTQELMKQSKEEAAEARMWQSIEAQVEAEQARVREIEMKRKENQEKSGRPLSEGESETAWAALGIDVPMNPVDRELPPKIKTQEKQDEEPSILLTQPEPPKNTQPPDWELVAKLSNLNQPIEGVPEAIDLDAIHEESETDSDETPTEEPILSQELAEKDGLLSEEEVISTDVEEIIEEENQFSGVFQSTQLDNDDWAVGW
jgi:hypothetical protein